MSGLTFLSWVREGLAAAGGEADPLTRPMPARTTLTLRPRLKDRAPVEVTARLLGPGDVTALDPAQILRTHPAPETPDAEPHLFAAVEFDRPDLPWMFSPAAADSHGRLRPWLVLVVLEADRAQILPTQGHVPRLRCEPAELPDLAESWAWAHAQVVTDGTHGKLELDRLITDAPDRSLSRLLCPRRLTPRTRYLAAVVPAFEAGRLAGLGRPVPESGELPPSWPPSGTAATEADWLLPAYHHWWFTTGLDGDFESLVRALTPRALPGDVGTRTLDIGDAGPGMPALPEGHSGRTADLEGALRTAGTDPLPWHPPTAAQFRTAYTAALETDTTAGDELAPPVYGSAQAGTAGLPSPQAGPAWLRELNLDPRHRAAAALGAEVVRRNQEELVSAAWDQAAEVRRANEILRQGQLARTVADSLHRRLPDATSTGNDGDDARILQMTAAAQAAIGFGAGTAAGELSRNKEAAAALTPAFRRLLRPGGPLARRAAKTGIPASAADTSATGTAASLARRTEQAVPELTTPAGLTGVEELAGDETFDGLTPDRLTTRWWETTPTEPRESVTPAVPDIRYVGAAMPNRTFVTTTDGRVMSRVTQGGVPGWVDHGFPPGTTAVSSPAAVRDLHCFVIGADGALHQLRWDGDQWAWMNHGKPPSGYPIPGGEARIATVVRTSPPSGAGQSGYLRQSVYLADSVGHLCELTGNDAYWTWTDRGMPGGFWIQPGGVRVVGPWKLHLINRLGKLIVYYDNGQGWKFTDLGAPAAGFSPDRGVPALSGGQTWGVDATGKLHVGMNMVFSWTWLPMSSPEPVARLVGTGHDDKLLVTTSTSRVLSNADGWPQVGSSRSPVGPDQTLLADVSGSRLHAVGDGKLMLADRAAGTAWQDLGRPEFGGKGATTAPPPRDIRWRPCLGFLSNLLVAHVDAPGGPNTPYLRYGRATDFDGAVRQGWQLKQPGLTGRMSAEHTQGFGIATADLDRSGRPDLVVFWIEDFVNNGHSGNFGRYMIGRNLDAGGDPATWVGPVAMPTPMSTTTTSSGGLTASYPVIAGSAALADLDGDGNQELLVAYLGGIPGNQRLFLRIGWNIDPGTGIARGGWADSVELPWPGRPSDTAPPVLALDLAVADLDGDLRPELIVMLMEQTSAGVSGSYRIGWDINARGRITGGWSEVRQIPGSHAKIAGAALAVADFSGTEKPDLAVLTIEDGPTDNTGWYRIGWDITATGIPRSWSQPVKADPGSWYGWLNQGAGLAVVDLPGTVADRRNTTTVNFRSAAKAHQGALLAAQSRADQEQEPPIALRGLADAVREALDPEQPVTARVSARIEGVDLAGAGLPDPLGPLLAPPAFPQPMAELLTELGTDHLLPGVQNIPPDTVTLLCANGAFIEAFLVGANHELARELLWREFPTDRRATSFRHFWDARGTVLPGQEPVDIPPIRDWHRDQHLGRTLRRPPGGADALVLLVRGEVVRRFPSLGLHARRALPPAAPGGPRRLGTERLDPVFSGEIGTDVLFLGFPLTAAEALGDHADPGWFFVFEEHPTAPHFGLDVAARDAVHGAKPTTWRDISWASVTADPEELAALRHLALDVPFTDRPAAPLYPAPPSGPVPPNATWGHNAAHMAHITLQQPVRVAHHASALLPSAGAGWRITHVRKRIPGSDQVFVREVAGQHPDGSWWRFTTAEALAALDARQSFHIEPAPGHRVVVTAVSDGNGGRHLRARADADTADNLLSLPAIPDAAYQVSPRYPEVGHV